MKWRFLSFLFLCSSPIWAACAIDAKDDALAILLRSQALCPRDVVALKDLLQARGLRVEPAMVANRGRHNPGLGSFSFFETVTGKVGTKEIPRGGFFFGHFTAASQGQLDLDQTAEAEKLLIELIVWDFTKLAYNFYELIGQASGGATWFYRGDSFDAFLDNRALHLQADPKKPEFGQTMRCSACHVSGGPILKELAFPHNDWWTTKRPLPFQPHRPAPRLKKWLNELISVERFAADVVQGQAQLESSRPLQEFKRKLSLREQLRPLFCTTEVNLVSGDVPLDAKAPEWNVPASYWVGDFFGRKLSPLKVSQSRYQVVTAALEFNFPETNRVDADHGWLAPVKGVSDYRQIESLIREKVITEEFAADVLMVDFRQPLFSAIRCGLLRLVPESANPQWQDDFLKSLSLSKLPGAAELATNFTDPTKSLLTHQGLVLQFRNSVQKSLENDAFLKAEILRLNEQRRSVFKSEISKNPRGQILEPGFRVIFPVMP